MRLADFADLISNMPVSNQALASKRSTWSTHLNGEHAAGVALRAIEEQAARELGQWRDKHELSGADGKPIGIDVSNMTDEQLRERLAKHLEKAGVVLMPMDEVQRLRSLAPQQEGKA
jgi:hypothetical protein